MNDIHQKAIEMVQETVNRLEIYRRVVGKENHYTIDQINEACSHLIKANHILENLKNEE